MYFRSPNGPISDAAAILELFISPLYSKKIFLFIYLANISIHYIFYAIFVGMIMFTLLS